MDLDEKRSEAMEVTQLTEEEPKKKTCVDCGTTKTPLWRGGPAGPMTLCNACGIKSRKKRGAMMGGSNKSQSKEKKQSKKLSTQTTKSSSSGNSHGSSKNKLGRSLDQRLIALGKEVLMRRSKTDQQRRRKLGEEEQAALLLMALSYGYVYA